MLLSKAQGSASGCAGDKINPLKHTPATCLPLRISFHLILTVVPYPLVSHSHDGRLDLG